ncbi:MAG: TolC family protein, partial [Candidatus Saccharicenans sp.]
QYLSEREVARLTASETRRQLAFEVCHAYLSTLSSQYLVEAARHRFDYARQALEAARARFKAGLVSSNDVTRAELEYATAELGITQAEGQIKNNLLQLGYLINDYEIINKTLVSPEFLIKASEEIFAQANQLIAEAQARRLDINSMKYHYQALRALTLIPTLSYLPSLSLTGQLRYTNEPGLTGRYINWNIGMALSWNLFDGFNREANYKVSKALAVEADLNLKAALRRVEVDVQDAIVALENQRAALKQANVAYNIAKKNADETAELYRQGLTSMLQVEQSNLSLFEAEVSLIQQRFGLGVAYLNLEASLGLDPFGQEPKKEE